jgi:hypothetical protein
MPKKTEADYDALRQWEVEQDPKPTLDDVRALKSVIDLAEDERPIQAHLAANPHLFSPLLGGGHGRWVRPKVRFGDRFEPDFMIADADSAGFHWIYVELESPGVPIFKGNGEFADRARHGMFQIRTWRNYVSQNGDLARKRRADGGLGLPHIRSKDRGLVLVGRTETAGEDLADLRRQADEDERISIHTYDWLVREIEAIAVDPSNYHHPGGSLRSDEEEDEINRLMYASPGSDVDDSGFFKEPNELEPSELEPAELEPDPDGASDEFEDLEPA